MAVLWVFSAAARLISASTLGPSPIVRCRAPRPVPSPGLARQTCMHETYTQSAPPLVAPTLQSRFDGRHSGALHSRPRAPEPKPHAAFRDLGEDDPGRPARVPVRRQHRSHLSVIVVVAIKSMRCAASVHQRCLDSWSLLICRYIVCDPGEVIPQNDWVSAPRGQMKRMADRGSLPMIVAAAHLDYCATAAALN